MIRLIINKIKYLIKIFKFRIEWHRRNCNNETFPIGLFNLNKVKIGKHTYGGIQILDNGDSNHKLIIGNFCSIGSDVLFLLNTEHSTNTISTFPFEVKILNKKYEAFSKGSIIINDDVWIGSRVTIMSGVTIGQGAIIAAGAVVTKSVAPYSIVGGVPAKHIKYRFSDSLINLLNQIDYSKINKEVVINNIELFRSPIKEESQVIKLLEILNHV